MSVRRAVVHRLGGVLHSLGAFRALHRQVLPDTISVVMYHGLVHSPLPVADQCFLPLEQFVREMDYLTQFFDVMHLEEALAANRSRFERPVACVTFDDGFASVHELALPVLERLGIPATAYLVTDLVDSTDTVWFARLHQAICETSAREVLLRDRRFPLTDHGARAVASAALQQALKALARHDFAAAFEDVLDQLGFGRSRRARPWESFRILGSGEIRRMGRDDLVRFGGHTASHQILTRTTREDARREIESSIASVRALVERPSRTFAYPNGRADDFDVNAVDVVREARIEYGVTTIEGPNRAGADRYRIRRYTIRAGDPIARFAGIVHHAREGVRLLTGRVPPVGSPTSPTRH